MFLGLDIISNITDWIYANWTVVLTVIRTIIDGALVWSVLYYLIEIVRRNMRTLQIFKGVLLVVIAKLIANILQLTMISWLVDNIITWGVVAIIVIFQPEIRVMLEKMGQTKVINNVTTLSSDEKEKIVNEVTTAVKQMSQERTGALISFERSQSMMDYIATGTGIDANICSELLLTIFMEGTMLHDGAVIIQGDRIVCASAFFPPTKQDLSPKYGARHRAALGLSEVSDVLTIVVSEESGTVSFALDGKLRPIPLDEFKTALSNEITGFIADDNGGETNE